MRPNPALKLALPKWPALTVSGKWLNREQTSEVLMRTNAWSHSGNDQAWEKTILRLLGVPLRTDRSYPLYHWEDMNRVTTDLGCIPLNYLYNSRVSSSWIGGPHGWLNWDGRIHTVNYNIGKWPSVQEVLDEWKAIAAAFPYLDLQAQLWSGETSESPMPVVEYIVKGGKARVRAAKEPLLLPKFNEVDVSQMFVTGRERGCSEDTLREALEVTRRRLPKPTVWERLAQED